MANFQHGITGEEKATSLVAINEDSLTPTYVGTAPVNMCEEFNVNKPILCYSYAEAVAAFGYVEDFENYTLCEAIDAHFSKFNIGPIVLINVLDPETHKKSKASVQLALSDNKTYKIPDLGVLPDTVVPDTTFDHVAQFDEEGYLILIPTGSGTPDPNVTVSYDMLDPSAVDKDDIIGGIDPNTGANKGMECISEVFPRFRLVPNVILAPKYSGNSAVAAVMAAKAESINGVFQGIALCDIDTTEVDKYTDVPAYKLANNLTSNWQYVCWPKVALDDKQYHIATQIACRMMLLANSADGIPYESPSNKNLQADSSVLADGTEVYLAKDQANYLNSQGIATALNWTGGWKAWGNRNACYPDNTDPKDSFLPSREMFNFLQNTLVLTFWQMVDRPANRVLIKTITDSINIWLNGLVGSGKLAGGRVEFRESENPLTSLIDGKITFHIYFTPFLPAEEIHFIKEIDVNYYNTLFE